jgi:hypothetical protein
MGRLGLPRISPPARPRPRQPDPISRGQDRGPACIDSSRTRWPRCSTCCRATCPSTPCPSISTSTAAARPKNRQGPFDLVGKAALLRAHARVHGFADDRIVVSETNWPLQGTGVWSPVTSPYETLDPRQNDPSVSEADYAAYLARYYLLALASGHVSRVYWWRLAARGFRLSDDTIRGLRPRPSLPRPADLAPPRRRRPCARKLETRGANSMSNSPGSRRLSRRRALTLAGAPEYT